MQMRFDLGETRHVKLMVHSKKQENFEISAASFELIKAGREEAEATGASNIYEHTIDTVITPVETGTYYLKIRYSIADEILIETVTIKVD